jgi:hypothetical protein
MRTYFSKQKHSNHKSRAVRFSIAVLGMALLSVAASAAEPAASPLMKAPPITLQSGDLSLRIQPSRAWTFDEIRFKGDLLNNPGAFSGLVFNLGSGKFVGSGHHEGGSEEVLKVQLTVDGQPADYMHGGVFTGDVELTKESNLLAANLKSVLRLKDGALECEQTVTPREDIALDQVYAFMFSWTTQTTEWMALTNKDQLREGDFSDTTKAWELTDNVQWTSIYNPEYKVAAVTIFPPDSQVGVGAVKHGYWNVKAYHKQYYQTISKSTLEKDKTYHWQVKVLFVPAEAAQWKEAVKEAVKKNAAH